MDSSKGKILIVGNELSLGEPIKKALAAEGYDVFLVLHPDQSNEILHAHRIDVMVVDCMLPRISGVDFVEQLKGFFPALKIHVILTSGIYTDKVFIQDAIKRTQASAFIKKELPFDTGLVVEAVKKFNVSTKKVGSARKTLYEIFAKEKVTNRERRKLIESLEEVSAFDLPFIYSLLVETKSSGYLNIYEKSGTVSGISFAGGTIVGVDTADQSTILGEMLIQSGYCAPKDVEKAVQQKGNIRLGQKLIRGNMLSPHAFDLILAEQMNIRLSRTISDQQIRINFAATEVEATMPCIDSDLLLACLHEWIASKLTHSWLKGLYTMWAGHQITATAAFRKDHVALEMSLIKQLDNFVDEIQRGTNINKLISNKKLNEAAVYKALHFLLTKGLIVFKDEMQFSQPEEQMAVIKRVAADFNGKSPFEVLHLLGVSPDDPEEALKEFFRFVGPEPQADQVELLTQWRALKKNFEDIVRKAGDTSLMDQMREATQAREGELRAKAFKLMEEAKQFLASSLFPKAIEKLNEVVKMGGVAHVYLYMAWAKLAYMEASRKPMNLKEIEFDIMQVPAEEKYDVLYPFVTGLLSKARGDFNSARKAFEKSVAIDSSFLPAKKELNSMGNLHKGKQDILSMDLKQVVSGFFKKR